MVDLEEKYILFIKEILNKYLKNYKLFFVWLESQRDGKKIFRY